MNKNIVLSLLQWRIQELTNGGGGGLSSADFLKNLYTPQPASYAQEGSRGMLPWKNLKTEASNEEFRSIIIFRPKYGCFFVFGTLNREGGGEASVGCAPLWICHCTIIIVEALRSLQDFYYSTVIMVTKMHGNTVSGLFLFNSYWDISHHISFPLLGRYTTAMPQRIKTDGKIDPLTNTMIYRTHTRAL